MRKYLSTLFIISAMFANAQDVKLPFNQSGQIEYTEVVQVDSASASSIYSKSKLFITKAFVSAKDVTQLTDDEGKTIVVKGLLPIEYKSLGKYWPYGYVHTKIIIQCKDGRYKYSITDLVHEHKAGNYNVSGGNLENEKPKCGTLYMAKKQWEIVKECTDEKIKDMISMMKKELAPSATKDNW